MAQKVRFAAVAAIAVAPLAFLAIMIILAAFGVEPLSRANLPAL